jgi:ABC-2 type transport system ATP-binding protein
METILDVSNLIVRYGKGKNQKTAVDALSFSLRKGEIYGFLGSNGAGKTTTIKSLIGILTPSSGSILFYGKPASAVSRRSLGFMPETATYYWYLTPRELLLFYGRLCGIDKRTLSDRADKLLDFVKLSGHKNSYLKTFSKGMLQKVSFAQALINDPEVLILDEPTTGLDPIARMEMRDALLDFKDAGKTIFFSSHELSEVEMISDRISIIKNGKMLREAAPGELINDKGERLSLEKYFFDLVKE